VPTAADPAAPRGPAAEPPDTLRAVTDRAGVVLPWKALAGSAAGEGVEALTLAALVLLVPRALAPADYGGFAVALALATGIATARGIGEPALFAGVLAPLQRARRHDIARALALRAARTRALMLAGLGAVAVVGALLAPGDVRALHVAIVAAAAGLGTAATRRCAWDSSEARHGACAIRWRTRSWWWPRWRCIRARGSAGRSP
jgi:hypothetical protein